MKSLHETLAKHGHYELSKEAKRLFDLTVSQEHDLRSAEKELSEHRREIDVLRDEIARLKTYRYEAEKIARSAQTIMDALTT